ncbi:MAG: hypothetical protein LAO56_02645 [Acidobacteriia bacterium]|nr:hypothetical protein [Terriglobia bacterium]
MKTLLLDLCCQRLLNKLEQESFIAYPKPAANPRQQESPQDHRWRDYQTDNIIAGHMVASGEAVETREHENRPTKQHNSG